MFVHLTSDHKFRRHEIECEFEGQKKIYDTWCRPLWSWVMDHLVDPEVVRHFEWDAQKVFRYDGKRYTQIFTEPWTGKRFWEIQVRTLIGSLFQIYSDRSRSRCCQKGQKCCALNSTQTRLGSHRLERNRGTLSWQESSTSRLKLGTVMVLEVPEL